MKGKKIREIVRKRYAESATQGSSCCASEDFSYENTDLIRNISKNIGYTKEEMKAVPEGANLGLGCGNPTALASLWEGETVLDLGSGAGFDCFLAADKVGKDGKVIGVDMTPEMVERARENARRGEVKAALALSEAKNVEFRLGEIESLPVEDNSVDVVISNCVINLSVDKPKVFREVYRVLKPGGRFAISDIALLRELPLAIRDSIEAYVGCIAGALLVDEYKRIVKESGLKDVTVTIKGASACMAPDTVDPIGRAIWESSGNPESLQGTVVSVVIEGHKPGDG